MPQFEKTIGELNCHAKAVVEIDGVTYGRAEVWPVHTTKETFEPLVVYLRRAGKRGGVSHTFRMVGVVGMLGLIIATGADVVPEADGQPAHLETRTNAELWDQYVYGVNNAETEAHDMALLRLLAESAERFRDREHVVLTADM